MGFWAHLCESCGRMTTSIMGLAWSMSHPKAPPCSYTIARASTRMSMYVNFTPRTFTHRAHNMMTASRHHPIPTSCHRTITSPCHRLIAPSNRPVMPLPCSRRITPSCHQIFAFHHHATTRKLVRNIRSWKQHAINQLYYHASSK